MTGKKHFFSLVLLVYAAYIAEARSFVQDEVIIYNRTDKDIFIEIEYWEEPEKYDEFGMFSRDVDGVDIFFVVFFVIPITRIGPNEQSLFLNYRPNRPLPNFYGRMRMTSLIEKIKSLIKVLKITNAEGDLFFSLEDAVEENFTVELPQNRFGGFSYFLEIHNRLTH
jgi:hypothetical protein